MRLSTTTLVTIALSTALVNSAPAVQGESNELTARQDDELMEILNNLQNYKSKREEHIEGLDKREYEIVTDVLSAINNTQLAPKFFTILQQILHSNQLLSILL